VRSARLVLEAVGVTVSGPDGRFDVLRDVTLRVGPNETIAIVGPSGAGKTTLLNVAGGLEPDHRGRVLLDGEPVWSRPEAERAATRNRRIGFVFQDANLIAGLTAEENLILPLLLCPRVPGAPSPRERARALLGMIGLGVRARTRVERLSGGERQRVAAARALIGEPDVVLADEPTGNLDTASARLVIDLLMRYRREHGATMLVATHDAELIGEADRVLALRDGVLHVPS
jgi:putative ABC transport system ATP-binding protein